MCSVSKPPELVGCENQCADVQCVRMAFSRILHWGQHIQGGCIPGCLGLAKTGPVLSAHPLVGRASPAHGPPPKLMSSRISCAEQCQRRKCKEQVQIIV